MTSPIDIIGIVKEHRKKIESNVWSFIAAEKMTYVLPLTEMDAMTQALLIAVESLEELKRNPTAYIPEQQKIILDALAHIRSLPTP